MIGARGLKIFADKNLPHTHKPNLILNLIPKIPKFERLKK